MKKIALITCLVLLIAAFTACGSNSGDSASVDRTSSSVAAQSSIDKSGAEEDKASDTSPKATLGKMGNNLKLPDKFPKDIIPPLDDANIVDIIDNKDAKALSITFTTGKKLQEVYDFYNNIMKGFTGYRENKMNNGYILDGDKNKYHVSATIVTFNGDNVSIMINIGMQDL